MIFRAIFISLMLKILTVNAIKFQNPVNESEWESFIEKYKKNYKDENEKQLAYDTLVKHKSFVEVTNKQYEAGKIRFRVGLNEFSDIPNEVFRKRLALKGLRKRQSGFKLPTFTDILSFFFQNRSKNNNKNNFPAALDWANISSCVGPIKDQGNCGSCWAFSANAVAEYANCQKNNGTYTAYSEQQLVDCASNDKYGNQGCNGGLMHWAYQYVIDNGGLASEQSYPYTAKDGTCNFQKENIAGTISKYYQLPEGNDTALVEAIVNHGPIAVAVDADSLGWQLYKDGVYDWFDCSEFDLNHAVILTGYGTETDGFFKDDYYVLRNSWGTGWGQKGYMFIKRGNNFCGVTNYASYVAP